MLSVKKITNINYNFDALDELERYFEKQEKKHEKIYKSKMKSHPDCRDPEHPGCELCKDQSF